MGASARAEQDLAGLTSLTSEGDCPFSHRLEPRFLRAVRVRVMSSLPHQCLYASLARESLAGGTPALPLCPVTLR